MLWERLVCAKNDEHRLDIVRGWLGTYSVAAKSPRLLAALAEISTQHPELGDLEAALSLIATRSARRRLKRRFDPAHAASLPSAGTNVRREQRGASGAHEERPQGAPLHQSTDSRSGPPGSAPYGPTRVEGHPVIPVAVQLESVVQAPVAWGEGAVGPFSTHGGSVDIPFELELRPGQLSALARFLFREHVFSADVRDVVTLAQAIEAFKIAKGWRRAGFASYAGFCRLVLREHEALVDRVAHVGLGLRSAIVGMMVGADATVAGEVDDEMDDEVQVHLARFPRDLLRRALRVHTGLKWAREQFQDVAQAVLDGRCTPRAARVSLHWSVGRAILQGRKPARRRTGVRWELRLRNGSWLRNDGDVRLF